MFLAALLFPSFALADEPVTPVYLASDEAAPVVAQAEDDDEGSTVKQEKDAVRTGSSSPSAAEEDKTKRPIKVIQKKNFMKIGRNELGATLGFVSNDPFLNRYILNAVYDRHLTEVFAVELQLGYSPIFGGGDDPSTDPDWKKLSKQLLLENSVSPDISELTTHGSVGLAFSPIYGKVAVGKSIIAFDIYGMFGGGLVQTKDDLRALQAVGDADAIATEKQLHPTTVIAGGVRVAFSPTVAARVEGKSMSYIETVNSTTLEMKNNFILQAGATFFFPGMK